jgi:hypothetical protein
MKKSIWAVAILVAFLIPAVTVTAANATHTDHDDHLNKGTGNISFTQGATISGPDRLNDRTTIVKVHETLSFTGNLTGTALTIQRNVMHNVTDEGKSVTFTTFHGWGNFTGTLNGNSVTLHIRYEGVMNSTFARGNFVVHGDTSQSSDVHGEGHFRGTLTGGVEGPGGSTVGYKMHWTVSTHADHDTEARDKDEVKDTD